MHISAYLMTNDEFLEDVAEVLIEVMQMPKVTSWRGIQSSLKEYICSQWFMAKLDSSIEGTYGDGKNRLDIISNIQDFASLLEKRKMKIPPEF